MLVDCSLTGHEHRSPTRIPNEIAYGSYQSGSELIL
jgi:hypothetical protein